MLRRVSCAGLAGVVFVTTRAPRRGASRNGGTEGTLPGGAVPEPHRRRPERRTAYRWLMNCELLRGRHPERRGLADRPSQSRGVLGVRVGVRIEARPAFCGAVQFIRWGVYASVHGVPA